MRRISQDTNCERPKGPNEVILTGTFDNWKKTLSLVKQLDGSFELTTPLPFDEDILLYKFVVDGKFKVSNKYPITKDAKGFDTNYLNLKDLEKKSESAETGTKENKAPAEGAEIATGATAGVLASEGGSKLGATVMPKEETQHPSIAGEPGVVIPKDSENLAAFSEYSNVDAKALNDTIAAEEKKKQKKKVKRTQYKAKRKQKTEQGTGEPVSGIDSAGTEMYNQPSSVYNSTEAETEEGTPEPKNVHGYKAAGVLEEKVPVSSDVGDSSKAGEKATSKDVTSEPKGAAIVGDFGTTDKSAKENVNDLKAGASETAGLSTVTGLGEDEKQKRKELEQGPSKGLERRGGAIPSTLDPKAQQEMREKETTKGTEKVKEPVEHTATPKKESGLEDEEIVIAQGNASTRQLEAAIRRDEPEGVSIEEYQPTSQEKAEFAKEAHIIEQVVAPSSQTQLPSSGGTPGKAQGKSPKSSKSFKSLTEKKAAPDPTTVVPIKSESTPTESAKAESAKTEAVKAESAKAEAVKAESAKAEAVKAEAVKAESAKAEAVKAESAKAEAVKAESAKTEAAKAESTRAESAKAEAIKAEAAKAGREKAESAKAEATKTESTKAEPAKDIYKGDAEEASKTEPRKEEPTKGESAKGDEKGNESKEAPKKKGFFSKLKKMFK